MKSEYITPVVTAFREDGSLDAAANEAIPFEKTFMVSATTGSGCDDLMDFLAARLAP